MFRSEVPALHIVFGSPGLAICLASSNSFGDQHNMERRNFDLNITEQAFDMILKDDHLMNAGPPCFSIVNGTKG